MILDFVSKLKLVSSNVLDHDCDERFEVKAKLIVAIKSSSLYVILYIVFIFLVNNRCESNKYLIVIRAFVYFIALDSNLIEILFKYL